MVHLGLGEAWIDHVLEVDKRRFSMIVLPLGWEAVGGKDTMRSMVGVEFETEGEEHEVAVPAGVSATWDGLLQCVGTVPGLADYVIRYGDDCRRTDMASFVRGEEFLQKYESIERVENCGLEDPVYLTPGRFLKKTERTFVDFRILLWTWFGASHCFTGDGITQDEKGIRGSSEYFIPNLALKELVRDKGAALLPLTVRLSNGKDPDDS
ncbi:unnamed protein product [Symbiodinium natans]|uniref:Uncharacterized protein n=1 Tax=Symbiodinium natans TaxID=878477 RepID=A0A812IKP8_9DINO|nr:unnamed protein product [Symbiodinium natans]